MDMKLSAKNSFLAYNCILRFCQICYNVGVHSLPTNIQLELSQGAALTYGQVYREFCAKNSKLTQNVALQLHFDIEFVQNCQNLNHVVTSGVITNKDVHEIADENSSYNLKEDGPNNTKHILGNISEDNSERELVLRMSEDDVEEDFTNLQKNDRRNVDHTDEMGSGGKYFP